MYYSDERIDKLEREVAILKGKIDPGLPCLNNDCYGGKIKKETGDGPKDWIWAICPFCEGKSRIYPKMS